MVVPFGARSVWLQGHTSDLESFAQLVCPPLLAWTFSPEPRDPLVPVCPYAALFRSKSLDEVPLSVVIAVIATAAIGAAVSMISVPLGFALVAPDRSASVPILFLMVAPFRLRPR